MIASSPAWSILGRKKEQIKNTIPGPGTYEPKETTTKETSPGFRLGTSKRNGSITPESIPGPGTYQAKSTFVSKTPAVFGTGKRPELSKPSQAPGPGSYELPTKIQEGPKFSLYGRPQDRKLDNKPGPGEYNPNDGLTTEKSPNYKIGTSRRSCDDPALGTIPGPGTYTAPHTKESRSWSLTSRKDRKLSNDIPGPGSYDPKTFDRMTTYTVGKAGRDWNPLRSSSPGPGAYAPNPLTKTGTAVFGTGKRPSLTKINNVPGPGVYEIRQSRDGPSFSLYGRLKQRSTNSVPGPGQYEQKINPVVHPKTPSFVIGKAERSQFTDPAKFSQTLPGPGQYAHPTTVGVGPKWGFGSDKREKVKGKDVPGPGTYELPATIANIPSYAKS